jgi:hypothetical protein
MRVRVTELTFFFQEDTTLGDHNRYVAIYVAFAMFVEERNRNVGVGYTLDEGYTKYALLCSFCWTDVSGVIACERERERESSGEAASALG